MKYVVDGVEIQVPDGWSETAAQVAFRQYFRKAGVPGSGAETSVEQMVQRVVRTVRKSGEEQGGYFVSEREASTFETELRQLLLQQKVAFNSPVWFNCGLYHAYGIRGQSENFHWNLQTNQVEPVQNAYEFPQCSACFIQSLNDDLMSIFDLIKSEARLFKYGSGTGTNFSCLRSKSEALAGGGTSSGLMSFLEVFDRAAGATKSGGTTRRAAKMVCLNIDHPEIEEFIHWKVQEEKKAKVLLAAGYSAGIDGEAYHTVSGQNSNNSIRVPDEFMCEVENDGIWCTTSRTDSRTTMTYRARDLWRQIAEAAWHCADPGVQFDSTIQSWHTCPESGRIQASNPCSEYMFLDDSACNLASINLLRFLDEQNQFDVAGFRQAIRVLIKAQDILVDLSSYPTATIAENAHRFRPLGLGYSNLGALLMSLGLPYGSAEACAWTSALTSLLQAEALQTSIELARHKGAFDGYSANRDSMLRVIRRHADADAPLAENIKGTQVLRQAAREVWGWVVQDGPRFGFRNAQLTAIAPTGTISLLMDCDTTGIEPEFTLVKIKSLAGGGTLKLINRSVSRALRTLGYTPTQIQDIEAHVLSRYTIEGAPHLKISDLPVFDCANKSGTGERFLEPMAHLRILQAAQPFVSGAISKTVNLPQHATVADVEMIYTEAWRMGLKSVAIYRDGSKMSQPLNTPVCEVCS